MYCGSCLRDNALAAALTRLDVDVHLLPLYTPIRTDEQDMSVDRVFFGGINVFLQQKIPLFRYLPTVVDRFLDRPGLIRWAASRGMETDAKQLGALAVSMLRGTSGYQRKEVRKLVSWLARSVKPQLVNLSNMLIAGCVPDLKDALGAPVLVTLQGDDLFLDELTEPYRSDALAEIRRLVSHVDGFIVFSRYYADFMSQYLAISPDRFRIVPMGVDAGVFQNHQLDGGNCRPVSDSVVDRPATIGYLARLCPAKGLHVLVDAFIRLRRQHGRGARLNIAGWLSEGDRAYAEREFAKLRSAGLGGDFHYAGTVDRRQKVEFLHGLDVLSVPTTYREPKGIYVLEALAACVPVVQPEHGAFAELLAATGGGRLVRPNDPWHLAETLDELLGDAAARTELARQGHQTVQSRFSTDAMAEATLEVYREYLGESD